MGFEPKWFCGEQGEGSVGLFLAKTLEKGVSFDL